MTDKRTDYEKLINLFGGSIVKVEPPEKQTELFFEGTHFKVGDIVRTIPCWYVEDEVKQGRIIGFSHFYYNNEYIPAVEIELLDGTFDKTHPSNIEKIDESWLEMC